VTGIVAHIEINRSPETVFAYVADPSHFPEWQADVVAVRVDGDRFTTVRRIAGTERTMTQQVIAREAPRTWSVRGIDGPVRPHADVTIEPLDGGARSRATFTFDFDGRAMGQALLPLVRRITAKSAPVSLSRLKDILET
jgi:uncharacterized protein YndB with AHSA1/START domain